MRGCNKTTIFHLLRPAATLAYSKPCLPSPAHRPALAVGNFDGDRRDDLAIGVPYEDLEYGLDAQSYVADAGAVNVIYGLNSSDIRRRCIIARWST